MGKDPHQTRSIVRMILPLLKPHWRGVLFVVLLIPVGAMLELVHPILLRNVVDNHLRTGVVQGLAQLAAVYVLTFVAMQVVAFLQTYVAASVGENSLRALRLKLFRHLNRLPFSYLDRNSTGDIISRCTSDVEAVGMLFSATLMGVFADFVRLGGIIIAMFVLNTRLALVCLVAVPVVAVISRYFRNRMLSAERDTRQSIGQTNAQLQENLTGMEIIRSFQKEEGFKGQFRRIQGELLNASDRSARYGSVFSPVVETIKALTIAAVLWYGTSPSAFLSWGITLGTLAAFVQLLDRFFAPITSLGQQYQTVQRAVAGAERILDILQEPAEDRPAYRPVADRSSPPDLTVTGVTFGYLQGRPILENIELCVSPGEHVALVGPTGGGKSSLVYLMAGLYAPWTGSVRIGGADPRGVHPDQRRRLAGIVPQHIHLFEGTVIENIRLGQEQFSEKEVWQALEWSGAAEFVGRLPEGLNTAIGASGVGLSTGQLQLLSLARALVGDPRVLLLDEATSSIDMETERAVQSALTCSGTDRTVITVAHRLCSSQDANRVVVLSAGQISEEGSPEVLAETGGWYGSMLKLQELGWETAGEAEG